jgi:C4-dicarboxylate-specific signal transduction histidine kinase
MRGIVQGMKTLAAPTLRVETAIPLTYALIEAVEIVRPTSATPIVLDADIAPEVGVVGDQASWVQVFVNLLKNAVAACDGVVGRAPRVEIRVESTSAHRLALRISDNGRGIPVRHLGRIFEPFFTTREVGQGTGLGLAVCLSTVRGLGGQLTVESVEGQGTSVRVELVRSRLTAEL